MNLNTVIIYMSPWVLKALLVKGTQILSEGQTHVCVSGLPEDCWIEDISLKAGSDTIAIRITLPEGSDFPPATPVYIRERVEES